MANEYTPKYIPNEPWKRITSVIRDYERLKSAFDAVKKDPWKYSTAYITDLTDKITSVEIAYNKFDSETQELVKYRFRDKRAYRDINMPLSERTMQRYIRLFVIEVGKNLGEL